MARPSRRIITLAVTATAAAALAKRPVAILGETRKNVRHLSSSGSGASMSSSGSGASTSHSTAKEEAMADDDDDVVAVAVAAAAAAEAATTVALRRAALPPTPIAAIANTVRYSSPASSPTSSPPSSSSSLSYARHCINEGGTTCQCDSDCIDPNGVLGADDRCGAIHCDIGSGTCVFNAWKERKHCRNTYRWCSGSDASCSEGGPTGLDFEGRCEGWNREECVYYWCPSSSHLLAETILTAKNTYKNKNKNKTTLQAKAEAISDAAVRIATQHAGGTAVNMVMEGEGGMEEESNTEYDTKGAPAVAVADDMDNDNDHDIDNNYNDDGHRNKEGGAAILRRLPPICSTPCHSDDDCIDPSNVAGTLPNSGPSNWPNSDCGSLYCDASTGQCRLDAWRNDEPRCDYRSCGDGTFSDDAFCDNGGPTGLDYVDGRCEENGNTECVYRWCIGGEYVEAVSEASPDDEGGDSDDDTTVPEATGTTTELPPSMSEITPSEQRAQPSQSSTTAAVVTANTAIPGGTTPATSTTKATATAAATASATTTMGTEASSETTTTTTAITTALPAAPTSAPTVKNTMGPTRGRTDATTTTTDAAAAATNTTPHTVAAVTTTTTLRTTPALTTGPTSRPSRSPTTTITTTPATTTTFTAPPPTPAPTMGPTARPSDNPITTTTTTTTTTTSPPTPAPTTGPTARPSDIPSTNTTTTPPPTPEPTMGPTSRPSGSPTTTTTTTTTTMPPPTPEPTMGPTSRPSDNPTTTTTTTLPPTPDPTMGPTSRPSGGPTTTTTTTTTTTLPPTPKPTMAPTSKPSRSPTTTTTTTTNTTSTTATTTRSTTAFETTATATTTSAGPITATAKSSALSEALRPPQIIIPTTASTDNASSEMASPSLSSPSYSLDAGTQCCQTFADCKADVGKPSLPDCGEFRCNLELNLCEFDTRLDRKGYCNDAYYVDCAQSDSMCTLGPKGSEGKCVLGGGTTCQYSWCPGVSSESLLQPSGPIDLPPVTGGNFWRPGQVTTWDWQLKTATLDYSRDVMAYDIDLFENTYESILAIKTKGGTINDPAKYRKVICYFSSGSWERWRPDQDQFPEEVLGVEYYGFPDERWLDISRLDILGPIMQARLDMAQQKGCDAVEPDNMDVYDDLAHEASGFPLTYQDQITYNTWLSEQAHMRGMACALKNDVAQADVLEPYFEFVVSEQCVQYNECGKFQAFIDAGKPIFLAEYELELTQFCPIANSFKTMAIKKKDCLSTEYEACPPWWTDTSPLPSLPTVSALAETTTTKKAAPSSTTTVNANQPPTPPKPAEPGSLPIVINVDQGFAGQAIKITGSDLGSSPGAVYWGDLPCPVTSWTYTEVRAYIADTAAPKPNDILLVRSDQVVSTAVPFEVKAPSLVPSTAMSNAFDFILREMRNPNGGIYTNRIDRTDQEDIYLYGHHVTSEHMGLMLWTSAAMLDHARFEESYQYVRDRMVDDTYNVINWGVDKRTGEPFVYEPPKNLHFNAPLDDFRVVKGLISGWRQWGDDRYRDLAIRIGGGLVETSVSKTISSTYPDGLVAPGFEWQENPVGSFTEDYLCPINYADLWTMRWLSDYDARWVPVIVESIELMEAAQLPVGQFWNSFVKDSQSFTGDFEYQDDAQRKDKIKTIQSLWTSIHLARIGRTEAARKALDFYKNVWYVPKGRIPEYLNPDGTETSLPDVLADGEVRIYSQLARLAYYLGEIDFADQVVQERVIAAQDTDSGSATFGHLSQFPPGNDSEAYETLEGLLGMAINMKSKVLTPTFPSVI